MNQSPRSGRQRHPCDLVIASAIARSAGCKFFWLTGPGVSLRSTPGSTLSAASRASFPDYLARWC